MYDGVSVMSCTQSHGLYNINCTLMQLPHTQLLIVTLSSQSTGWTALMFAVNGDHKDIVQRLVSAGADVHIRDKVCGDMESVCQMLDVVPNGLGKIVCTIVCEPCTYMGTECMMVYQWCHVHSLMDYTIMKSTKVLNPRQCIMRVHEKYACAYKRNTHAVQKRMLYRYSFLETVNTRASYVSIFGKPGPRTCPSY